MKEPPTIVVLGGSGMLGHKLFQRLRTRFTSTICMIHKSPEDPPLDRIDLFQGSDVIGGIDAFNYEELSRQLLLLRPEFLVNCIGVIKQRKDAAAHIPTLTLNSLLPHRLAELCSLWDGRLIHFSTDCVFNGRRGMYKEEDPSDAEDLYGMTKFLGETSETNALTLRTSIIGRELTNHHSLLDWFLSNRGKQVSGYLKAIYSGVTTNHLAEVVGDIIAHNPNLHGLYQVASQPICKYELLLTLREAYGLDVEIIPVDGEITDRSMDGSKFREETGYQCPTWTALARQLATDPTPYEEWVRPEHQSVGSMAR
jgi:dTDP-4-dehydrorhamnose reductase